MTFNLQVADECDTFFGFGATVWLVVAAVRFAGQMYWFFQVRDMTSIRRSPCPLTASLDLVGDKWSLLVVRDLIVGKARYGEFLDSPEGIPTNILAERLRRLQAAGLVRKRAYQSRPARYDYRLTKKGRALVPVLQELARWGHMHLRGTWRPPARFMKIKP